MSRTHFNYDDDTLEGRIMFDRFASKELEIDIKRILINHGKANLARWERYKKVVMAYIPATRGEWENIYIDFQSKRTNK